MKLSLNWLSQYIDLSGYSTDQICEMLTDLGLEVEGTEIFESLKGGLEGVVVGEVKACWKHPNADKLSLTKVDIGRDGEWLQIVCGAPNVATGQKVLVAKVGTTLFPTGGGELILEERKVRGELSQGMICAQDELGMGEDHSGILVLPADVPVGLDAKSYFQVVRDTVIEIGLTPNRSDATSHTGVAHDLAATMQINHGFRGSVKMPDITPFQVENNHLPVSVVVENTEACPRYSGLSIEGLTVTESPEWLKNRLKAIGVRPINNVVDVTNFVLKELGQPLHAFDLDHIAGRKVIVKTLPEGTKFVSLDEVERQLYAEDLMICDGDSNGMCIGGVFGGIHSGVKESTKNIFLEAAHFNPKYIRRSKTRHHLHTDAAFIFEKGSDPNLTVFALKRAAMLIRELAGGNIASEIVDIYPQPVEPCQVPIFYDHINRLIGETLSPSTVRSILDALQMEYLDETEKGLTVLVPTNKWDVTREADVIEEILRVYGLNKVPIPSQVRSAIQNAPKPDPNQLKNAVADLLAANGFHEMMALSLSESRYYSKFLPVIPDSELVYLNNTSNIDLDIMRPTMLFGGLEAVVRNQNRQIQDLRLFEFGKTYRKKSETEFEEQEHLALFVTGQRHPESWLNKSGHPVDFFTLKAFADLVFSKQGLQGFQMSVMQSEVYEYAVKYHRGEQVLAELGKVRSALLKKMDIRNAVFYADFYWDNLLKTVKKQSIAFEELNKFPGTRRDLALVVDQSVQFDAIAAIARKTGKKILKQVNLFDVFTDQEKLGTGKKSYAVSFNFEDPEKTLSDKEVDQVIQALILEFEGKLGAIIRR